jgi:hypothetical protein
MTDNIKILFAGDISLGGEYVSRFGSGSPDWAKPFSELESIFRSTDLRIGNLESPLFQGANPHKKRNLMGASSDSVKALNFLDFTALNLANNHFTDQGREGIKRTCKILDANGISYFGAGENLEAAVRPAIIHANGLSLACLGYASEAQDVGARTATISREGCAPLSLDRIERDIALIRGKVSHIIVSLHWGYQFDLYPEPEQVDLSRKIIDLGALIVHGHHPHVVQGLERYKNGLILYSLGNFFFPDFKRSDGCRFHFPKESWRTVIVQCEVDGDGVHSVSMVPLLVDSDYRIRLLRGHAADRAAAEYNRRSAVINKPDYVNYWSRHHKKTVTRRARLEGRLGLCAGIRLVWQRVRERGLWTLITRLRIRHLVEIIRRASHFIRKH